MVSAIMKGKVHRKILGPRMAHGSEAAPLPGRLEKPEAPELKRLRRDTDWQDSKSNQRNSARGTA